MLGRLQNSKMSAAPDQSRTSATQTKRLQTSIERLSVPPVIAHTTRENGKNTIIHVESSSSVSSGSRSSGRDSYQLAGASAAVIELFGFTKGKKCTIPLLSCEEVEPRELFDWAENAGKFYFIPICLYALSLNGCLTYDQDTFIREYSPVFALIDNDAFEILLEFFFPCERFVRFYRDKSYCEKAGGRTLNFYLA